MQTDWRNFLTGQGAQFHNNSVIQFSAADSEAHTCLDKNTLTPLTDLSIIEISGAEARHFLNAQFTTDISQPEDNKAQLSAWCNPKGRVISNFFIFPNKTKYYLFLPTELKDSVCRRLQMYVLRAAVTIKDRDDELVCLGFRAHELEALLLQKNISGFLVNDKDRQRAVVFGEAATMQRLWTANHTSSLPTASGYWQVLNNLAGLPWIRTETSEAYLPQALNLDLIDGLSFNKGCYPGQEIVARVHYRGQVKWRSALALVTADKLPQAGDKLYVPEQARSAGSVINVGKYRDRQYLLLCVLDCTQYHSREIRLGANDGPLLAPQPLPYAVKIN